MPLSAYGGSSLWRADVRFFPVIALYQYMLYPYYTAQFSVCKGVDM
jgi:hypothetical protein